MASIRQRIERWSAELDAPGRPLVALGRVALYATLRVWVTLMDCFPVGANLVTARVFGTIWWKISPRHRERALVNLRAAFGAEYSEAELQRIAKRSFEHIAQLYLVELGMTPKLVNEWSWTRYVELDHLANALRELLRDRPVVMVTPHFGNYELLGYTLARLGFHLHAVMRPLDNPLINDYLVQTREAGGLSLLIKKGAADRAYELLANRGVVCFIADQDAGPKGTFVDFFGRKASHYKSIGLLAMQHRAPIVCGYAARIGDGFRYRICVERVIQPEEWEAQANPLQWVTQQYAAAMEAGIRRFPEQYLWMHRRWKSRPRDEKSAATPGGNATATA